jgi:SAM-dependent methyltransferase
MNHFLHGVARALTETFDLPAPILEVGSYQVPGQEALTNLRPLFAGKAYRGTDARPGPGVDLIADVEALPHADSSIGTVVAMNTFEHVPHFWRAFAEVRRVLRPDGALLMSCPFHFRLHDHPSDFWRFTPEAVDLLLADYPSRIIGWHGPARRPAHVWALAFREERPPVNPVQFQRYRDLLREYAREPRAWRKRWRYHFGRWLFGLRPFAPFLQHNRWETVCRFGKVPAIQTSLQMPPTSGEAACPSTSLSATD